MPTRYGIGGFYVSSDDKLGCIGASSDYVDSRGEVFGGVSHLYAIEVIDVSR